MTVTYELDEMSRAELDVLRKMHDACKNAALWRDADHITTLMARVIAQSTISVTVSRDDPMMAYIKEPQ